MKEKQEEEARQQIIDSLREENQQLKEKNSQLLFALQDAWPYVHAWCTIRSMKRGIERALFGEARTQI